MSEKEDERLRLQQAPIPGPAPRLTQEEEAVLERSLPRMFADDEPILQHGIPVYHRTLNNERLAKHDHPAHYGGKDNPYEAIKVIEAWSLDFCLGNLVKYVSRAGKKAGETKLDDLLKARWYLDRAISNLETKKEPSAP